MSPKAIAPVTLPPSITCKPENLCDARDLKNLYFQKNKTYR